MVVYSSRKFLAILAASVMVGLLLVSFMIIILPSYFERPPSSFRAATLTTPSHIRAGGNGNFKMNLKSVNGFSGSVHLTAVVTNGNKNVHAKVLPERVSLNSDGTASFTVLVNSTATLPPGDYSITLIETSGGFSHSDVFTLSVSGISLNADPGSLNFVSGSGAQSNITVTSVDGFSGNVVLVASPSAKGPEVSISPSIFYLDNASTASAMLTVSSKFQGNFDVTVTAVSDQLSQSITLPVTVQSSSQNEADFEMTVEPNPVTVSVGDSFNAVLELHSVHGCSCLVTISTNNPGTDLSIGIDPSSIGPLSASGKANATLFINSASTIVPGTYSVTITGTSLSTIHSTTLTIIVTSSIAPDFTISADPLSLNITLGGPVSTEITLQSINGYAGRVNLSASITPDLTMATLTFSNDTLDLRADAVASSNLTISVPLATGLTILHYNITITGTSGTISHIVVASLQISTSLSMEPLNYGNSSQTRDQSRTYK